MNERLWIRRGAPPDLLPALEAWRAAEEARRNGPASPEHGERVRAHIENPTAFLFVAPDHWGKGVGGSLIDADNTRAQTLYQHRGFHPTGRQKQDDQDEPITHHERNL